MENRGLRVNMKKAKFMTLMCYVTPVLSPALSVEVEWEQTLLAVPSANGGSIRSAVVLRAD